MLGIYVPGILVEVCCCCCCFYRKHLMSRESEIFFIQITDHWTLQILPIPPANYGCHLKKTFSFETNHSTSHFSTFSKLAKRCSASECPINGKGDSQKGRGLENMVGVIIFSN